MRNLFYKVSITFQQFCTKKSDELTNIQTHYLQTDVQDRAGNQCSFSELMHAEVLLKFFYHTALSEECLHHLVAFNDKRIQTCKMFRLLTKLQYMTIKLKKNHGTILYLPHSKMKFTLFTLLTFSIKKYRWRSSSYTLTQFKQNHELSLMRCVFTYLPLTKQAQFLLLKGWHS